MMRYDQRREPRFPVDVEVSALVLGNPDIPLKCQLLDVSRSGAQVLAETPVCLRRVIKIEWGEYFLIGSPRYVKRRGDRYLIGLEHHGYSLWSDDMSVAAAAERARHLWIGPLWGLVREKLAGLTSPHL
jgi:hypothetical protein